MISIVPWCLFLFGAIAGTEAPNNVLVVRGAGSAIVDGTYELGGQLNANTLWLQYGDQARFHIWYVNGEWRIGNASVMYYVKRAQYLGDATPWVPWAGNVPAPIVRLERANVTTTNQPALLDAVEPPGVTCTQHCSGLPVFWEDVNERLRSSEPVKVCQELTSHANTTLCVLQQEQKSECHFELHQFVGLVRNCSSLGIDITTEQSTRYQTNYTVYACTTCSSIHGAVARFQYSDKDMSECEAECESDEYCAAFDFEESRNKCRTWSSCTSCSHTEKFGCGRNVYEKPGAVHFATSLPAWGCADGSRQTARDGSAENVFEDRESDSSGDGLNTSLSQRGGASDNKPHLVAVSDAFGWATLSIVPSLVVAALGYLYSEPGI